MFTKRIKNDFLKIKRDFPFFNYDMNKLLYGIKLSFSSEPVSQVDETIIGDEDMSLFRERCKQFKKRDLVRMETNFLRLFRHYSSMKEESFQEKCLKYEKGTITFSPLSVTSGGSPASHQRDAFFTMIQAWKEEGELESLVLDLKGWNHTLVKKYMKDVCLQDVVDGIWLWRVLPMKIKSIIIMEPNPSFFSYRLARSSSSILIPKKVRNKIIFK